MRILLILFGFVFCLQSGSSQQLLKRGLEYPMKDKIEVLRQYVYCKCLSYAYEKDSTYLQDASISVLYELSDQGIRPTDRQYLDSIAISFVDSAIRPLQPGDYGGKKATMLYCLNFYNSKELTKYIKGRPKK